MQPLASQPQFKMDVNAFRSHLAATITWCRPRFAMDCRKESLRSDDLRPSIDITTSDELTPVHRAIASVIDRRTSILGPIDLDTVKMDGRLFGFYVRYTFFDGVSEIETDGFIDDTNTPPWDSWVCMVDELLISWIPPAVVDDVQRAIEFNAEECITWLSDVADDPFVAQLRQNQLVW